MATLLRFALVSLTITLLTAGCGLVGGDNDPLVATGPGSLPPSDSATTLPALLPQAGDPVPVEAGVHQRYDGFLDCGGESFTAEMFWSDARWPLRSEGGDRNEIARRQVAGGFLAIADYPGVEVESISDNPDVTSTVQEPDADSWVVAPIGADVERRTPPYVGRITLGADIGTFPIPVAVTVDDGPGRDCTFFGVPAGSYVVRHGDFECDEHVDADSSFLLLDAETGAVAYLSWLPSNSPNYVIGPIDETGAGSFVAFGIDDGDVLETANVQFSFAEESGGAAATTTMTGELTLVGVGTDPCQGEWQEWPLTVTQQQLVDQVEAAERAERDERALAGRTAISAVFSAIVGESIDGEVTAGVMSKLETSGVLGAVAPEDGSASGRGCDAIDDAGTYRCDVSANGAGGEQLAVVTAIVQMTDGAGLVVDVGIEPTGAGAGLAAVPLG